MTERTEIPRLRRVPTQARSRARLRRLLDTAEQVLANEGAEALTTTRVAEAAGVSVGSLYQYLPDKGAMVQALARRYLADFEALMSQLERDALRSGGAGWDDPVGRLIDEFSERYRELPGYRALWFGRDLSDELRAADRENKLALARGVRKIAVALNLARDDDYLRVAARAGVLVTDSILQEAFRLDPNGDSQLIEEAKRILRLYLAEVGRHYAPASSAKGPLRR